MTFALSSEPDKYDKKLAISTLNVDSKTLEYASAFSKNDGTGTIITILKQITAENSSKNRVKLPVLPLNNRKFQQNIIYNIDYWI